MHAFFHGCITTNRPHSHYGQAVQVVAQQSLCICFKKNPNANIEHKGQEEMMLAEKHIAATLNLCSVY